MSDAYLDNDAGEWYCEYCADDSMQCWPDGGGASDCPQNCAACHRPLGNPLTEDGVRYVLDAMRETLKQGRAAYMKVHPCYDGTYYEGSPHVAIVRDWAEDLSWYGLEGRDKRFLEHFLGWTQYAG